jgi:hypothetical protein
MNATTPLTAARRLGHRASFSLLAIANVLLMASTSAPSPIYPLYLHRWGFSVTILTVIFAVYVAGLVAALLTVGSLSDHLGRRPVLIAFSRAPQWWHRLPVTPFGCNNIRDLVIASRWRVRCKIGDRAIVTMTALTAVSLMLAAPASSMDRHGTDGRASHTATSASQDRHESIGGSSQRSRRDGVDNVGKVATHLFVGEPTTAAEPDTANPEASEAWLPGHDKCKRRRGLRSLPLWCTDPAAGWIGGTTYRTQNNPG